MVKKLKAEREQENKNPIFLNIGDNFVGSLWYELFGWNVTSHFLNILPADATTLGMLKMLNFNLLSDKLYITAIE